MRKICFIILWPLIQLAFLIEKMLIPIRKFFRKKIHTTVGEFYQKHRHDSKKKIIREILSTTGAINDNPGYVDPEFYKKLRQTGKKGLLKALCVLKLAYSKKLQGKKGLKEAEARG